MHLVHKADPRTDEPEGTFHIPRNRHRNNSDQRTTQKRITGLDRLGVGGVGQEGIEELCHAGVIVVQLVF